MAKRRVSILLTVATVALLGFIPGAVAQEAVESGTWRGMVVEHSDHFDYVGSPCPVQADFCIMAIYTYEIVPVTRQAAAALPRVAGRQASLTGYLVPADDDQHQGILYVDRVTPARR